MTLMVNQPSTNVKELHEHEFQAENVQDDNGQSATITCRQEHGPRE